MADIVGTGFFFIIIIILKFVQICHSLHTES